VTAVRVGLGKVIWRGARGRGLIGRVMMRGACGGWGLLSHVSLVRVCLCVCICGCACVCVCQ
jgi:hypothetical protein